MSVCKKKIGWCLVMGHMRKSIFTGGLLETAHKCGFLSSMCISRSVACPHLFLSYPLFSPHLFLFYPLFSPLYPCFFFPPPPLSPIIFLRSPLLFLYPPLSPFHSCPASSSLGIDGRWGCAWVPAGVKARATDAKVVDVGHPQEGQIHGLWIRVSPSEGADPPP